jgi:hypothetical protein
MSIYYANNAASRRRFKPSMHIQLKKNYHPVYICMYTQAGFDLKTHKLQSPRWQAEMIPLDRAAIGQYTNEICRKRFVKRDL